MIRSLGWTWLRRLKSNRKVRVDFGAPQAISTVDIPEPGRVVHLPGYGSIRVFRVVATDGDTDHWATNDLGMDALTRLKYGEFSWRIEEYHRGIKQFCGVRALPGPPGQGAAQPHRAGAFGPSCGWNVTVLPSA